MVKRQKRPKWPAKKDHCMWHTGWVLKAQSRKYWPEGPPLEVRARRVPSNSCVQIYCYIQCSFQLNFSPIYSVHQPPTPVSLSEHLKMIYCSGLEWMVSKTQCVTRKWQSSSLRYRSALQYIPAHSKCTSTHHHHQQQQQQQHNHNCMQLPS